MKTIRFWGIALLAVLLNVTLFGCSKSDDDNGESSASVDGAIEGTWYMKSETWYNWDKTENRPGSVITINNDYGDYSKKYWVLTKSGDNIVCMQVDGRGSYPDSYTQSFYHLSGNEYCTMRGNVKHSRVIFKSVSEKQMIVEYYEGYYGAPDEWGIMTFMR